MRSRSKGSSKKYRDRTLPCQERERLLDAYWRAKQREYAQDEKGRSKAALRAAHIFDELLAHERKHGCVPRFLPELKDD
jgi:hypothetical protein